MAKKKNKQTRVKTHLVIAQNKLKTTPRIGPSLLAPLIRDFYADWKSWVIVVALGFLAGYSLFQPGYFNMHDDLQMMRQLAMEECFLDFQIPCRWTPHMGYGFGFPLFNYYPPLPYVIGEVFRLVGFSFVDTVKAIFILSIVLSGIAMYFLGRALWGRLGGLVSTAFYIWAPYHALDVFVRGAMNEAWALIWFPLILWSSYKLIHEAQVRYIVILAISWFGLFTSHNLMVIIFSPLFAVWTLLWLLREKSWFTIPQLALSSIWGFGLASFFSLPVIFEKELVHVESLVVGYYEYKAHFADLNQLLFSRYWGFGPSVWLEDDRMSFQIGHLHWVLSLLIATLLVIRYLKARRLDSLSISGVFFLVCGWAAAFMAHSRSTPLWETLEAVIKFVQFPWRFLTLVILSFSTLSGVIITLLPKKRLKFAKILLAFGLLLGVIILNFDYFKPEKIGPLTDEEKFSGAAWDLQQTAGIYDYLPVSAKFAPRSSQTTVAEVVEGQAEFSNMEQRSNRAKFDIKVISPRATVRINIFEFPNWRVFVDKKEVKTFVGNDELGRMHVVLEKGEHSVSVIFANTPIRSIGNFVSLFSWTALITVPFWRRR